jgi:aminoglycoside phosphotransferase (APT) family kinase protein
MGSLLQAARAAPVQASVGQADMEPACAALVARRTATRGLPAYSARNTAEVAAALERFFARERPGGCVLDVQRMGGGASKEQFLFTLAAADGGAAKYVLRMDPLGAITETDRRREYEILDLVQGLLPAPKPVWLDAEGAAFGQPAVIMDYVTGVTKPSGSGVKVSGLGTHLGEPLRTQLRPQFLDHLVRLHALDWRSAHLPSFSAPTADPQQAARWSLNWWKALWRLDGYEERPIGALALQWLSDNLPDCSELVLTHGDYRTGNYLFDEATGRITALLDWELARIGDFHEDLAWVLMQVFGTFEDGVFRASDLYGREEFIAAYEQASGRTVNRRTLHFYDVFSSWKCFVIVAANGLAAARAQQNHQDVLLTFLGATSPMFADDLCRLLEQGAPQ